MSNLSEERDDTDASRTRPENCVKQDRSKSCNERSDSGFSECSNCSTPSTSCVCNATVIDRNQSIIEETSSSISIQDKIEAPEAKEGTGTLVEEPKPELEPLLPSKVVETIKVPERSNSPEASECSDPEPLVVPESPSPQPSESPEPSETDECEEHNGNVESDVKVPEIKVELAAQVELATQKDLVKQPEHTTSKPIAAKRSTTLDITLISSHKTSCNEKFFSSEDVPSTRKNNKIALLMQKFEVSDSVSDFRKKPTVVHDGEEKGLRTNLLSMLFLFDMF